VPSQYRDHRLLQNGLFFTLPQALIEAIQQISLHERLDQGLWNLETELARQCAPGTYVGFWSLRPIEYKLLRSDPVLATPEEAAARNWTETQLTAVNECGADRVKRFNVIARAYVGWLLANRKFLTEHHQLFEAWKPDVAEHGLPSMGPVVSEGSRIPGAKLASAGRFQDFLQAFETFFVRWRLSGMAAPFLPVPLQPQLPVTLLQAVLGHMRHGGKTFYLPDTFPVPSRDELRDILEEALRGSQPPEHLLDWSQKVQANNAAKNTIPHFARLFALQHYWRAIYQRHGDGLRRSKAVVEEAMSAFLGVSTDSIRHDLGSIAEVLGEEWWLPAACR
jgi:hypothetical protein